MKRRDALIALAALPFLARSATGRTPEERPMPTPTSRGGSDSPRLPAIFAAHGAPILLDDPVWVGELAAWAQAMPKPRAVLMVSAHWEERPATIGATRPVPLVYDFYGFPEKYYRQQYPAPGAPELAERVRGLLAARKIGITDDPERGLDHGAYVPLVAMYPEADVPVLQVSMPGLNTTELFELGRALAPLRDEGVLLFGSGFLTHNMSYAFRPGVPQWAREFDTWAEETLTKFDVDALLDFQKRAPSARMALPTWEHYAPLLVAVGAAADSAAGASNAGSGVQPKVSFPITGFWMDGAFTKRSVQLG